MERMEISFENFIAEVHPAYREFITTIHTSLQEEGYKLKIERKANGYLVSYAHPKTKRSLLNFLFRKQGLLVRIYGEYNGRYADFINTMPAAMEKEISKGPNCKRLINPEDCNSRCPMGYAFTIGDNSYKKCRYGCFQFAINEESMPVISQFLKLERQERQLG